MVGKKNRALYLLGIFSVLLIIWGFSLRDAFSGDRLYALYEDNEFFLGAIFSGISGMYRNGVMPLRLDTILAGYPLYNFTQITPFYPFYGFFLDVYAGYKSTVTTLHWLTVLHLFVMLLNMNYLLRTLGSTRIAALTGATLFTFGADMFTYALWVNIIAPYSWFPLYIAGVIGLLQQHGEVRKNIIIVIFSLVMLVASSPSQPLIHALLATIFIVAGYVIFFARTLAQKNIVMPLIYLFSAALIAVLICAPMLVPATLEAGKMIRWIGNFPAIYLSDEVPFDAFVFYKLQIQDAWQILFDIRLENVGSAYLGFFVWPLALLAFIKKNNWLAMALLTVAIYSLLSSFGDDLGMAYLNHKLPLINKIREPSRFLALFQFGMAVLAAIGISNLASIDSAGQASRERAGYLLGIGGLVITAFFILAQWNIEVGAEDSIRFSVCILLIVATITAVRYRQTSASGYIAMGWSIAVLASLTTAVSWQPRLAISDSLYVKNGYSGLDLAIASVAEMDPLANYRLMFDGDIDKGQAAMLASYRGVRTFNYYVNPAPISQAVDFSYDYSPYYAYQGAAFLICRNCDLSKYTGFSAVKTVGEYGIFFDASAYPRIFVGKAVDYFTDTADFISKVADIPLGGARRVFVQQSASDQLQVSGATGKTCEFISLYASPIRHDLSVDCEAGQIAVLNEYHDGNWRGFINGVETNILRVNGNQNGLILTGASQFVTFEYKSAIFAKSLYLSLLGLAVLILLLAFLSRGKNSAMTGFAQPSG